MNMEIKPLAVRLRPEQRARLDMLAKLTNTTPTEIIRTAVDRHLDALVSDPAVAARAEEVKAAIQQDAANQQAALAGLFDTPESKPASKSTAPKRQPRS